MAPLVGSLEPPAQYERPQPRPPRSPAHAAQIRVRNRRREWLSRHPSYFDSLEHELADPILYDALIRRFQSAEEREKEGRTKGFGRVLEVDLLRGEARMSSLADEAPHAGEGRGLRSSDGNTSTPTAEPTDSPAPHAHAPDAKPPNIEMSWEEMAALEARDLDKRNAPQTADDGRLRWNEFLRLRFVAGKDDDFSYQTVDEDDEYDAIERREQEDAWFENEEPGWIGESSEDDGAGGADTEKAINVERPLTGETGVQDF
ncbi:coiled-coil domain-containing protein-domain-containing protein [Astrocystis sublimbata]|nr:coiled-coil domain-containing protein-domain-containing protein [Astrocystis sublimbata]